MLLTLSQMAKRLNCSVRTFSRDVRSKRIPYKSVGKRKRFDPLLVEGHLLTIDEPARIERRDTRRTLRPVTKYDSLLEAGR